MNNRWDETFKISQNDQAHPQACPHRPKNRQEKYFLYKSSSPEIIVL
jgi:hypothetical protein